MMAPAHQRRAIPRAAARPATMFDDPNRRAALSATAARLLDLTGRVVDELLAEAANPDLTSDGRRGLVAIAVEVDRQAAVRTGTAARTVEIAARGRAALAGDQRVGTGGAS